MTPHKPLPQICGTTTVGERGQAVIPSELRKSMQLKTGEKLMVFCMDKQFIGLVRVNDLDALLEKMTRQMTSQIEAFRKQVKKVK